MISLQYKKDAIIDAHTHSSGISIKNYLLGEFPYCSPVSELVRMMTQNHVDYAITMPMPNPPKLDIAQIAPYGFLDPRFFSSQKFVFEKANRLFLWPDPPRLIPVALRSTTHLNTKSMG